MKIEFKPSKISFDSLGFEAEMRTYVKLALDEAEEKYIELMRQGVDETMTAPKEWFGGIKDSIRHLETLVEGSVITYVMGIDTGIHPDDSGWMRAMVVAYGMGILGLNGNKIMAGGGREVWDNDLATRHISTVQDEHEIPQTWYHAGSWFIQNATMMMRTLFADIVESALLRVPGNIVSKYIRVSAG